MAKVGAIDDPVWAEEPPLIATEPPIAHAKGRRRWLAAAALLILLTVGGWWLFSRHAAGSGDPGGKILDQLTPAASALPGYGTTSVPWASHPSTSAPYLIESEPHMDSCDGMAGTQGWSQAVVQGSFHWPGSHEALFATVDAGIRALGWHREQLHSADQAFWKKRLENGTVASAMLNLSPLGDPNWEFVALAAPDGHAVGGC